MSQAGLQSIEWWEVKMIFVHTIAHACVSAREGVEIGWHTLDQPGVEVG
jgi:hypothetical protein